MAKLDTDMSRNYGFYGMIFINSKFKEMAIEIYEHRGSGLYQANGWIVSAPCVSTKEAIKITQRLFRR